MKLSEDLIKKLSGKFEPATSMPLRFRNIDIVIKTDKEGNAVQMFLGKANDEGKIKGDRYTRTLIKDKNGIIIKDHWERKGKAS